MINNMKETERIMGEILFSTIYSHSTSGIIGKNDNNTSLKYDEKPTYIEFAALSEKQRKIIRTLMPIAPVNEEFSVKN